MHTTTEFTYSLESTTSENTGRLLLHLRVETVRDFSSFGYTLTLTDRSDPASGQFEVEIGGIQLPTNSTLRNGPAVGELTWHMPPDGDYTLHIIRRREPSSLKFSIRDSVPHISA